MPETRSISWLGQYPESVGTVWRMWMMFWQGVVKDVWSISSFSWFIQWEYTQADFTNIPKCFLNDCLSKDSSAVRTVYKNQFPRPRWCLQNNIFLSLESVWRVEHTASLYIIVKNNYFFLVNGKDSPKEILRHELINQNLGELKGNNLWKIRKTLSCLQLERRYM